MSVPLYRVYPEKADDVLKVPWQGSFITVPYTLLCQTGLGGGFCVWLPLLEREALVNLYSAALRELEKSFQVSACGYALGYEGLECPMCYELAAFSPLYRQAEEVVMGCQACRHLGRVSAKVLKEIVVFPKAV